MKIELLWVTSIFIIMIILIISVIYSNTKYQNKQKRKMKLLEEKYSNIVNKYYDILINEPLTKEIRERRKENQKKGTIILVIGLLIFFIFPHISFGLIIFGIIKMNSNIKEYDNHYKENIMKKALNEYKPYLTYFPNGCIPEEYYQKAKFENYDTYNSEDRINGKLDGNDFMIADVHVEDKRETSDGTTYVTLFKGPVAIMTLPNTQDINIAIINNKITNYHNNLPKINIDNPIFEDIYDVYSDNQILAMRILTPAVTNKILSLYTKYDFKFEVKIINNTIYFRFYSGELFAANSIKPKEEALRIAVYFEILTGIEEMMKEFMKSISFLKN